MRRRTGFTLIELLIVIAIIGTLAAVLVPNLLRARSVASDKAAVSYAQNVYKAAQAYLAEDPLNHTLLAGDCMAGVNFGGYIVRAPGSGLNLTSCNYTSGATTVSIVYNNGTTYSVSLGD